MGNVTASGIRTPDQNDNLDPEVWSAIMAASIENGLGERMNKQETRVSLRATAPEPFEVVATGLGDAYIGVPLTVGGVTNSRAPEPDYAGGNHANGITIEGNYATVETSGLYSIVGQISFSGDATPHSFDFYGTINGGIFGLPAYGLTNTQSFVGGFVSDTRYLIAGDTVGLTVGVGTDHIGTLSVQDALLTMSMVYAT